MPDTGTDTPDDKAGVPHQGGAVSIRRQRRAQPPVPRGAGDIPALDPRHGAPAGETPHPVHVASASLLRPGRLRRILTLAGLPPRIGLPGPQDCVVSWGMGRTARRAVWLAARRGARRIHLEDAWLRSIHPGRVRGEPPLGLLIDRSGLHYDPSRPSDLERLLATHPLDDTGLIERAHAGITRLIASDLSKYNAHDPDLAAPDPGYVLVIDQTRGDASVHASGADRGRFLDMLARARDEHPGAPIVLRMHPETAGGARPGHFEAADAGPGDLLLSDPVSPWRLLEGARAVYTVSSQMGFEAILAGHRPRVFGQPFYAGWGLTEDEAPHPRRNRRLTRAQMFAAAMLLYPVWYDPCRDRLCDFETALAQIEAERRAYAEDRNGHVALGMRLWKRRAIQRGFGRWRAVRFEDDPARAARLARRTGRCVLAWGRKAEPLRTEDALSVLTVEDGFLRSRGLGAELVPALSLVTDDRGIYYDPRRESRLDRLISAPPPPGGQARARALIAFLQDTGVSKYNPDPAPLPDLSTLPPGRRILVPGQVEDDASVELGAPGAGGNLGLLRAARQANPTAAILYKPHPDVEAGLREGRLDATALAGLADLVVARADPASLLGVVDEVWTLTSGLGFEALLRGLPVTCLGAPFYAGWGLTRDLGPVPPWRRARPDLTGLVHAALIAYPRYFDPVTGRACPVEVVAERLATGETGHGGAGLRLLSRLQGLLAAQAWIWRAR